MLIRFSLWKVYRIFHTDGEFGILNTILYQAPPYIINTMNKKGYEQIEIAESCI